MNSIIASEPQNWTLVVRISPISFEDAVESDTDISVNVGKYPTDGNGSFTLGSNTAPLVAPTTTAIASPSKSADSSCLSSGFDQELDQALGDFISAADVGV